ncbi:uncharacterized protein TRUGW13939_02949 [Talaromyces rugulosus]|uniref:Rhodanese domain-containing protein n=1 Tax=Talaromyces rugulosus TaxID=121627 RepID=A0A7H8QPG1_TALRU|nr:uncharacterized protein TRUGW13939_02949 [Talaromyces rugulosus]QKX55850.1 hypothetical protein TRUGW13939_02949 [Talaromyces rugulosus]
MAATTEETPWHAAFPAPKITAASISRDDILQWLQGQEHVAGRDFVLVDVRRTDFEGGTIKGSLNFPAHSFYLTVPTVYAVLSAAGIKDVVFYCGSSRGRGPRTAGWFADYLESQGNTSIRALVLKGGIKGWVAAGDEYTALVSGYEASVWKSEQS